MSYNDFQGFSNLILLSGCLDLGWQVTLCVNIEVNIHFQREKNMVDNID